MCRTRTMHIWRAGALADPLELVHLLYEAAIDAVREARRHLAEGEIAARCVPSPGHSHSAELVAASITIAAARSRTPGALYDYMQRRLLDANFRQADEPLAEVLGLLATLAEAWQELKRQAQPAPPSKIPGPKAPGRPVSAYGNSAWSL